VPYTAMDFDLWYVNSVFVYSAIILASNSFHIPDSLFLLERGLDRGV
jgi:hypothetical protein